MLPYRLRKPLKTNCESFSKSKPIWPIPNLQSGGPEATRSRYLEAANTTSAGRSNKLFQQVIGNYVIRQYLFEHLPPMDVANVKYATGIRQEMGTRELERYLHPMRHVFSNAELDTISKRIAEGYAIVLWGRDLKELVGLIEEHSTTHTNPIYLRPYLRSIPQLHLAITDFAPSNVPIANKSKLPGFTTSYWAPFLPPAKAIRPTAGIDLSHYESDVAWDGSATDLPLPPYVPAYDVHGTATYVIGGYSPIVYYINVHEQPLVLKMCYGSMTSVTGPLTHIGWQRLDVWGFEASVRGSQKAPFVFGQGNQAYFKFCA